MKFASEVFAIMKDSRRSIVSWALYDWANSAFATTVMAAFFSIFFSSYWSLNQDSGITTFWLGIANSVESLIVAVLAPMLGAVADCGGYRKKFLVFFAFLGALLTGCLGMVHAGGWIAAMFIYVIACVGFAGANIFYDALLPVVASEKKVDFVSALGYSLGYIGGGLLFLVNVLMYLFPGFFGLSTSDSGVQAVKASFIMVAIWWIVFTLPLLIFVKDDAKKSSVKVSKAIAEGFADIVRTFRSLRKLKMTALFLVAFWCYIDGVDTIIRMAVDYGTALGFPSESLIVALLITQFVAFPAALAYNSFGKKIGHKKAILVAIGGYALVSAIGFFMTNVVQFYILACVIGLFQGGIQALSRSYFTRFVPSGHEAQFFGFYNMLGKFAAIIGPALMGIVTLVTGSHRAGILSLIILFAAGGILLYKVDEERGIRETKEFAQLSE